MINFGNHQFPGHESWYGDPVGVIDCGPHLSVLNSGYPWHAGRIQAESLLAARPATAIRVINAFEANAPLTLLDTYKVRMIHDAHGIGRKSMILGPRRRRVGKSNSESFRIVRFCGNQVISCTYNGHETAPIPLPGGSTLPLSVSYGFANDGTQIRNTATVTNRFAEAYPDGRVTFVAPAGQYEIHGARLESAILSDDGLFNVLAARVHIPADGIATITVKRTGDHTP